MSRRIISCRAALIALTVLVAHTASRAQDAGDPAAAPDLATTIPENFIEHETSEAGLTVRFPKAWASELDSTQHLVLRTGEPQRLVWFGISKVDPTQTPELLVGDIKRAFSRNYPGGRTAKVDFVKINGNVAVRHIGDCVVGGNQSRFEQISVPRDGKLYTFSYLAKADLFDSAIKAFEQTAASLKIGPPPPPPDTFTVAVPDGWTLLPPDTLGGGWMMTHGGTSPYEPDARIQGFSGPQKLPTAGEMARLIAGADGHTQQDFVNLDGEQAAKFSNENANIEQVRVGLVAYHGKRMYLLFAFAKPGTDVAKAFDAVAASWKWARPEDPRVAELTTLANENAKAYAEARRAAEDRGRRARDAEQAAVEKQRQAREEKAETDRQARDAERATRAADDQLIEARRAEAKSVTALPGTAEMLEQLKAINAAWTPRTGQTVNVLAAGTIFPKLRRNAAGVILDRGGSFKSKARFKPPVSFRIVALTLNNDLRIGYAADQIIFNWEMRPTELRIDGGPANRKYKPGAGTLPINAWTGIELVVERDAMTIYVDGEFRHRVEADFSKTDDVFTIESHVDTSQIKSITAVLGPAAKAKPAGKP